MVKRVVFGLVLGLAVLIQPLTASSAPSAGADDGRPSRVLIVVIDAFRPDYIERFDMENVKALMDQGSSFPNGIVGHMASTTVVSHSVMTSGLLPKNMGWSNEVHRDVDNTLGGGAGANYVTSSMSCDQFRALSVAGGYPRLSDYLDNAFPEGKFFAIGQKPTATCTAAQPADADDSIITFGSRSFDCDGDGVNNWRGPTGANVPTYISQPMCLRACANREAARLLAEICTADTVYPIIRGVLEASRCEGVWPCPLSNHTLSSPSGNSSSPCYPKGR
jgi:Type I phosphodiesterase / nucleotide pyrophosphatase